MTTGSGPQTRGFLFADLRGYSSFTEEHGDAAAAELIGRYRALVRTEIAAFHGAEIRTEGDSFYVVFGSVSEAVQAGLAIRDAAALASAEPGTSPIDVGIGIHAGESTDGEQGIVSSAVNIAARVCSVAESGEVLVTDTVRSLTRSFLPIGFTPRGRPRLKGIAEPIALYRVAASRNASQVRTTMRPTGMVAAVAAGGLLVAAVAVSLTLAGNRGAPPGNSRASVPATAPGDVGPSQAASPPGRATYPDEAELSMLDRLPAEIADSCERADAADVPVLTTAVRAGPVAKTYISEDPLRVTAGVTCLTDLTRVVFWQASDAAEVDAIFVQRVAKRGVSQGSCAQLAKAWEEWESAIQEGKLMCSSSKGVAAAIEWTYGDEPIYAIAVRRDGDAEALLAWWRDVGRTLSR